MNLKNPIVGILLFSITAILLTLGMYSLIGYLIKEHLIGQDMLAAAMVLGGASGFLIILVVAGMLYQSMGLADKSQAFGLPEGSIRAIVATLALLLFGIVPLFLFTSLSTCGIQTLDNLSETDTRVLKERLGEMVIKIEPALPPLNGSISPTPSPSPAPSSKPTDPATGNTAPKEILYKITFFQPASPAAVDLSKQFFTALATLVSAVSSFFFGSAVATSATKAGAKAATDSMISTLPQQPINSPPAPNSNNQPATPNPSS